MHFKNIKLYLKNVCRAFKMKHERKNKKIKKNKRNENGKVNIIKEIEKNGPCVFLLPCGAVVCPYTVD